MSVGVGGKCPVSPSPIYDMRRPVLCRILLSREIQYRQSSSVGRRDEYRPRGLGRLGWPGGAGCLRSTPKIGFDGYSAHARLAPAVNGRRYDRRRSRSVVLMSHFVRCRRRLSVTLSETNHRLAECNAP